MVYTGRQCAAGGVAGSGASRPTLVTLRPHPWRSFIDPFLLLLQQFQRRWPAQRAVARRAGIDHARYNRLVNGDVAPSGREQVLAIAAALALRPDETDQLAAAAGFLPPCLSVAAVMDPAFRSVLAVLRHSALPDAERQAFRQHVLQAATWLLALYPEEPSPTTLPSDL